MTISIRYCFLFVFLLVAPLCLAQQGTTTVHQDDRISALMTTKAKLAKSNKIIDGYTIQLCSCDEKTAKETIRDYQRYHTDWEATILYAAPYYKVWAGNFHTRLEADRALLEISKNFPNAFVLKPER